MPKLAMPVNLPHSEVRILRDLQAPTPRKMHSCSYTSRYPYDVPQSASNIASIVT